MEHKPRTLLPRAKIIWTLATPSPPLRWNLFASAHAHQYKKIRENYIVTITNFEKSTSQYGGVPYFLKPFIDYDIKIFNHVVCCKTGTYNRKSLLVVISEREMNAMYFILFFRFQWRQFYRTRRFAWFHEGINTINDKIIMSFVWFEHISDWFSPQ